MKIQTLSIVVGSAACNARCPFCVSKMTPPNGVELKAPEPRWDRLQKALQFAEMMNVTTVILTGKGEPTLFPTQLLDYVTEVGPRFPFVELQTNGLTLMEVDGLALLKMMKGRGLTTVALSVVSYDQKSNGRVYLGQERWDKYPDLSKLIARIHDVGLSVRLSVVLCDGGVHGPIGAQRMITFARDNEVEQLSFRPVTMANDAKGAEADWIKANQVLPRDFDAIVALVRREGTLLLSLQHGAEVYDVEGQNVCLTDCLTLPKGEEIRQAIYFPDGHLRYDWQYPGAILM